MTTFTSVPETMNEDSTEHLTLRPETVERIRRAAREEGMEIDAFLRQMLRWRESLPPSSSADSSERGDGQSVLDEWEPPESLRTWIGLALSESPASVPEEHQARVERIHRKHVERKGNKG